MEIAILEERYSIYTGEVVYVNSPHPAAIVFTGVTIIYSIYGKRRKGNKKKLCCVCYNSWPALSANKKKG